MAEIVESEHAAAPVVRKIAAAPALYPFRNGGRASARGAGDDRNARAAQRA
jgi:hypothetical protein